jgi:regulator of sigma E protease
VTTLLAFLFVLGVLVFVHELGHFLAAKRLGVRVLTFSVGFGPKILRHTRGGTEYCLSILPLGGYVKMAGDNPDDSSRSGAPDEFLSRSKWERFQVLVAGPLMNVVTAVVVMAVVLAQGTEVPLFQDEAPEIGVVLAGSPAEAGGIQPGDVILSVDGADVPTWEALFMAVGTRPDRDIDVTYRRGSAVETVTVRSTAQTRFEIGDIGVLPEVEPLVASVIEGSPAEAAGLQPGDVVLAVNGQRMATRAQLVETIAGSNGAELEMMLQRDGRELTVRAIPEPEGDRYMLGFFITEPTRFFQPSPLEAVWLSVQRNVEYSGLIFQTLGGLVTGQTSVRQLQGPVGIAQLSGESAQAGWIPLFSLMAILSINLGVLNLLPIPVLDGGHIAIMAMEGIARRDFSIQVKEKMLLAGFVVLMMLMVTVIYNDLTRVSWIEQLMPWRN